MKSHMKCEPGLFLLFFASKQSWFDGATILVASAVLFARMEAYRCVRMCLDDFGEQSELSLLGVCELLTAHLAGIELSAGERKLYRAAVAVSGIPGYDSNPRAFVSDDSRWKALGFAWANRKQPRLMLT